MSVDAALAARVEIWIYSAGYSQDRLVECIETSLRAGFAPPTIRVVLDDADEADLTATAQAAGVAVMSPAVREWNERLDATTADTLFLIRHGVPAVEVIPAVVGFMDRFPGYMLVYGDSLTHEVGPLLRPLGSPIRLLSNDYLGPIVAIRTADVRKLGGFRPEAQGAHVLDLALRVDESGGDLGLLPKLLAGESEPGQDPDGASDAQVRVVAEALERRGVAATIEEVEPFIRRVRYHLDEQPLVSIVIPTRGSSAWIAGRDRILVVEAIRGIVERSTYPNLEFVVVADAETPRSVIEELETLCGDRLRLSLWDAPFNFSAKMNRGAVVANGEYLLMLNDDVEVVSDDWIESMLGPAQQKGVGIVGALLYFEDSTLQHAGQIYTGGVAGHAAFGWRGGQDDQLKSLATVHEVSGVTAACALLRRELYFEVGGFTLALPGNYNDVDLNMKIRSTGRSAVFTPWARLYHFESKTRDPKVQPTDIETLQSRWMQRMLTELYSRML